jgi:hypothetical protein
VLIAVLLFVEHAQQHCYHHDTKVKPEAATAVIELLMTGLRTPETLLHLVGDTFELYNDARTYRL